jgi:hypothetical protein
MQVLFDLRPPHLVALQSQRVDISRVLSVLLFFIFISLSIYNIAYTAFKYLNVRQELNKATGEQVNVRSSSQSLAAKIQAVRAIKTRIVAYLEFTREELPAVEFLNAIEYAIPTGLKIASIAVRPGNVLMRGSALSDEEIIVFGANLDSMKYIVTKVNSPITTKSVLGTRQISDFSITCDIKKILDIAAEAPNQQVSLPDATAPVEGGGNQ